MSNELCGDDVVGVMLTDNRHCDLRGNLIKAMMVMNWLNMVDVDKH